MSFHTRRAMISTLASVGLAAFAGGTQAQKKYDTGVTDTEIKIGHIVPYSGPVSAYGTIGKAAAAYIQKINDEGGVNGRKISFLSLDDAYNPAKTVEQTRKLVEQDEVLLMFGVLGTAQNAAIQRYLTAKKVPQLFVASGATRWGDPKTFPWTMGWQPTYQTEGRIYAQHLLATKPNAKVGILSQNDDFGRDYVKGFMDGLGDKAKSIVVQQATYEVTDPTIDSQMVALKASGADTFYNVASPKFAAQAIRKAADIGWKPTQYLAGVSTSVSAVLKPAGLDAATGVLSAVYLREPSDARWKGSKELTDYETWFKKYYPTGDIGDSLNVIGYSSAQTLVQVLKQAGNDLTRANIMKQAASLKLTLPMLYPGVDVRTSADDFHPIKAMQPVRFNGTIYEPIGAVISF